MKWIKERDLFIAQTMAFVQSVTGKAPAIESRIELAPVSPVKHAELSTDIQMPRAAAPAPSDLRIELQNRISHFRAHQERFNREREEYFLATLAKARAAIESGAVDGKLQK